MCETTCPRTQCPARRNTLVPLGPCRLAHGSGGSCAHWNGPPSSARPAHPLHPGASPRPMQSLQPAASSYSQAGRRNAGLPTSACDLRVCAEGEAGPRQSTLACLRTFASLFSDRRVPLPASSSLRRRALPTLLLAGLRKRFWTGSRKPVQFGIGRPIFVQFLEISTGSCCKTVVYSCSPR